MAALMTQATALSGTGISARPGRRTTARKAVAVRASSAEDPLLLRVARGEQAERPPVWLMRQAGRYMAEFREYSNKYGFRHRSETPDIAIELSLQPWRAFKPDGVIMFSDILTPLPALGVEFDVVKVRTRSWGGIESNRGERVSRPVTTNFHSPPPPPPSAFASQIISARSVLAHLHPLYRFAHDLPPR